MILETYSKIIGERKERITLYGGGDYYNDLEPDLLDENQNLMIAFYELMYENNKNWFEIESQLRISECMKIEEGYENILTEEGSGISGVLKKIIEAIKTFFKKLGDIIISIIDRLRGVPKKDINFKNVDNRKKVIASTKLFYVCEKFSMKGLDIIEDIGDIQLDDLIVTFFNDENLDTIVGRNVIIKNIKSGVFRKKFSDLIEKNIEKIERLYIGLNKYINPLKSGGMINVNDFNKAFNEYITQLQRYKKEISVFEAIDIIRESDNQIKYLKSTHQNIRKIEASLKLKIGKYKDQILKFDFSDDDVKIILNEISFVMSTFMVMYAGYVRIIFQKYMLSIKQLEKQIGLNDNHKKPIEYISVEGL